MHPVDCDIGRAREGFAECIERACPDIAEDDTDSADRERRLRRTVTLPVPASRRVF